MPDWVAAGVRPSSNFRVSEAEEMADVTIASRDLENS